MKVMTHTRPACVGSAVPREDPENAVAAANRWVVMEEDRRRRGIAFENLAKEMLRYLGQ